MLGVSATSADDRPHTTASGHVRTGWARVASLAGAIGWPLIALVVLVLFFGAVRHLSQAGMPLFVVDEHVHTDYVAHLWDGQLPTRGSVYSPRVVYEANCGVGLVSPPPPGCAGTQLKGAYSSAYIHYPTFFALAALIAGVPSGSGVDITGLRTYSALVLLAGLLSLWLLGYAAHLKGAHLAALVTVPSAAAIFFRMGAYFNPSSASLVLGSLTAAGGFLWLRSRRGYWFFLFATLLSGITAVTSALPAGAIVAYGLWVWGCRVLRRPRAIAWQPTWWQLGAASGAVIVPWFLWGRWISGSATVGNADLYAFAPVKSIGQVARGMALEALSFHSPWFPEPAGTKPATPSVWFSFAADVQQVLPAVITILVLGALITTAIMRGPTSETTPETPERNDLLGVATAAVLVLWAYPPGLRLTNAVTFGMDVGIVSRYSMSLAPLLVVLALRLVPQRVYAWLLALAGLVMMAAMAYAPPIPAF